MSSKAGGCKDVNGEKGGGSISNAEFFLWKNFLEMCQVLLTANSLEISRLAAPTTRRKRSE